MNATDYWPMAREYFIWNTAVAALQFWTAEIKVHVLSSAIEQVYNAFFYSTSTDLLCQKSDKMLFSHLVTSFNAAFESKLALEDEGYESSSENFNIPTPLRRTFLDSLHFQCWECLFWSRSSYTMQHRYQPVTSQTCTKMFNLQFLQRWGHTYRWDSFTCQYSIIAESHRYPTAPFLQVHP